MADREGLALLRRMNADHAAARSTAGASYGRSDDWGYKTAERKTYLHATILHLLGIDHERLMIHQNGIDRRFTHVHGHVLKEILA